MPSNIDLPTKIDRVAKRSVWVLHKQPNKRFIELTFSMSPTYLWREVDWSFITVYSFNFQGTLSPTFSKEAY